MQLDPVGGSLLVAGVSGGGKSTKVAGILEQLAAHGLRAISSWIPRATMPSSRGRWCWATPTGRRACPRPWRCWSASTTVSCSTCSGVELADRPAFLARLLPELSRLRGRTGRPHWIVIDEAHHMLPAAQGAVASSACRRSCGRRSWSPCIPTRWRAEALALVRTVLAVGAEPAETIQSYCAAVGRGGAAAARWRRTSSPGRRCSGSAAARSRRAASAITGPRQERRRHTRKYAEGELGPDRSFYFRGPESALNLRAQNLSIFVQMAEGVDDATW